MAIPKIEEILTHDEFRSPFVTPQQRKDFLLKCAYQGLKSIVDAWPNYDIRMFAFGSVANNPSRIGAGSDLDIAISGLNHIAKMGYEHGAILLEKFKTGLAPKNRTLPVDALTFDAANPETSFAEEILRHGIEIKLA